MQVKAVLFDLGGTLIKTAEVPVIYKRILGSCGVDTSCDQILAAHEAIKKELDVAAGMAELGYAFWRKWNLKMLERLGVKTDVEFVAKKIDELWWDKADLEFYPDVMETLSRLKLLGIKRGIVTNALKEDYNSILQKLGAKDLFDVVVGVDSCKTAKPHKEIFTFAVRKLHVSPEETVFVGDLVREDYEGARAAGLRPVLIRREGKTPPHAETIKSLTEVLSYISGV